MTLDMHTRENHLLEILTAKGIPMHVRRVMPGDAYGSEGCLTNDHEEPLIEFFDKRFVRRSWPEGAGQFVSRYYETTLLEHIRDKQGQGLMLDTATPDWSVDAHSLEEVGQWIAVLQCNDRDGAPSRPRPV